ncbi:unnamed protein product [Lactuca virosa]|uniref:Uncharacterized protein n=1 Tax=Lactuca virosa TaxID=75947 RepID=A0AAU9LL77_9ASTR|nr:unnamed protein product [Lactuca virosa]
MDGKSKPKFHVEEEDGLAGVSIFSLVNTKIVHHQVKSTEQDLNLNFTLLCHFCHISDQIGFLAPGILICHSYEATSHGRIQVVEWQEHEIKDPTDEALWKSITRGPMKLFILIQELKFESTQINKKKGFLFIQKFFFLDSFGG